MEEEGVFVGSGGLRVARERALEILKDYRVPEAGFFALSWLRCAIAAGASSVRLSGKAGGFSIRFKGKAFTAEDLDRVYDGVLGGGSDGRLKELGLGLLTALRSEPASITVVSGEGGARVRLELAKLGGETVSPEKGSDADTVVSVRWGRASRAPDWRGLLARERVCALAPCPVLIDDAELPRLPCPPDAAAFAQGKARGWQRPWPFSEHGESRLWIYRHGVLVQETTLELPLPVLGLVEDAKLSLDIAQSHVVREARWGKLLRLLGREELRLLRKVLAGHERDFTGLPERLEPAAAFADWTSRGSWQNLLGTPEGWDAEELQERPLARAGLITDWLHRCAANLAAAKAGGPERESLEAAPLFLTPGGGTASLAEVRATHERLGTVPYSLRRGTGLEPGTLWCPSPRELGWIRLHFGQAVREV
ncbi:MAG: hypothetical protein ABII00_03515 [Elusimicrobiota bacterium]